MVNTLSQLLVFTIFIIGRISFTNADYPDPVIDHYFKVAVKRTGTDGRTQEYEYSSDDQKRGIEMPEFFKQAGLADDPAVNSFFATPARKYFDEEDQPYFRSNIQMPSINWNFKPSLSRSPSSNNWDSKPSLSRSPSSNNWDSKPSLSRSPSSKSRTPATPNRYQSPFRKSISMVKSPFDGDQTGSFIQSPLLKSLSMNHPYLNNQLLSFDNGGVPPIRPLFDGIEGNDAFPNYYGNNENEPENLAGDTPPGKLEKLVLDLHNHYRAKHGSPPLKYSREISAMSIAYAQKLLKSHTLRHSQDRRYGENLAYSSGYGLENGVRKAVEDWYNESRSYSYGSYSAGSAGHFTQLVWKASRRLGIGIAYQGSTVFTVCNYHPPGNVMGQYYDNVKAPNN